MDCSRGNYMFRKLIRIERNYATKPLVSLCAVISRFHASENMPPNVTV
jgi:hypothetical protein